jgi:CubicO group peptidase (beta-lactamase class C family)
MISRRLVIGLLAAGVAAFTLYSSTLGFGILTDPAAAKSRLPAGSYGWGGIYGTQFWVDPANRVVGLVMTQTAVIGSGAISNPIREAFYTAD